MLWKTQKVAKVNSAWGDQIRCLEFNRWGQFSRELFSAADRLLATSFVVVLVVTFKWEWRGLSDTSLCVSTKFFNLDLKVLHNLTTRYMFSATFLLMSSTPDLLSSFTSSLSGQAFSYSLTFVLTATSIQDALLLLMSMYFFTNQYICKAFSDLPPWLW